VHCDPGESDDSWGVGSQTDLVGCVIDNL
jgi:hypothetical protein